MTASATLGEKSYVASRNLAVTGAVIEGVDPQTLAGVVNFLEAVPADKSIVIAGAGGNGRSETAILRFKVVDGTGAAVPGVRVTFETIPANVVTLNSATGTTDASGVVSASVSSKAQPTSVVVKARVVGRDLLTQSDSLTVTTGPAVARGFDLSASKYVLNNDLSGDSSEIRIAVVDENGNPVTDGFSVVATTPYGRVGSSDRGGCKTSNGECSVEYQVQDPRPGDGVPIPVVMTAKSYSTAAGQNVEISKTIQLFATSVDWISLYAAGGSTPVMSFSGLVFDASCKAVWSGDLGTARGLAAPAGATLEVESFNSQVSAAVSGGSPVLDSRDGRRTAVNLRFSLKDATVAGTANLQFTLKAGNFNRKFAATLNYPACTPAP